MGPRQLRRQAKGAREMAFKHRRGGDFQPLLKWDGRVGRFYTQDRVNGQNVQADVTDGFAAILDLEHMQYGWLFFPKGGAPETHLVPVNQIVSAPPDDRDWREGLRVEARLQDEDVWRASASTRQETSRSSPTAPTSRSASCRSRAPT